MADVHGKRALLNLCDANGLRLSSPARARSAPYASAACSHRSFQEAFYGRSRVWALRRRLAVEQVAIGSIVGAATAP